LLAGAPLFLFITGIGRGAPHPPFTALSTNVSRYLHVAAVLVLPGLAFAANEVVTRWRWTWPLVAITLLVGVPGNVGALQDGAASLAAQSKGARLFVLSVPENPIATQLPRSLPPRVFERDLTMGWLLDGVASGRVPAPRPLTPTELANQTRVLALRPSIARPTPCAPLPAPVVRVLSKGESLRVTSGRADVAVLSPGGGQSLPEHLQASAVAALAGPLRVRVVPARSSTPVVLCG
jgi:hypothetical protein